MYGSVDKLHYSEGIRECCVIFLQARLITNTIHQEGTAPSLSVFMANATLREQHSASLFGFRGCILWNI